MKILIIRTTPEKVRIKRCTYNLQEVGLAKALIRAGHICDIVYWTNETESTDIVHFGCSQELKVVHKRGKGFLKNAIYKDIDTLAEQYNVIQLEEYNQYESWRMAKKYSNKVVIYHGPYDCDFNKRYNMMSKGFDLLFLKRYQKLQTRFITKSTLAEDFLRKRKLLNVKTIGVGLDREAMENGEGKAEDELFDRVKDIPREQLLLYIGQLQPRRNIPFLFAILRTLNQRGRKMYLVMIGNGKEEYTKECFEYARKEGVYDQIIWKPRMEQNELSKVYDKCILFLLPTYYEIFGMVLLESMYYGTVPITTVNGGSRMLIEDGYDGIIVEDMTAELWSDKIEHLIDNKIYYQQCSGNGCHKIMNYYIWDKLAPQFIEEYEQLLS